MYKRFLCTEHSLCGCWLLTEKPYSLFAGREVARALATLDLSGESLTQNLDGLGEIELETLEEWEEKFMSQYPIVAKVCIIVLFRNVLNM